MTIYSKKAARRRAIRTLLDAAAYVLPHAVKSGVLPLSDFLAFSILIQAAHKLGYRGPQDEMMNLCQCRLPISHRHRDGSHWCDRCGGYLGKAGTLCSPGRKSTRTW